MNKTLEQNSYEYWRDLNNFLPEDVEKNELKKNGFLEEDIRYLEDKKRNDYLKFCKIYGISPKFRR